MFQYLRFFLIIAGLLIIPASAEAASFHTGDDLSYTTSEPGDAFFAGSSSVTINAPSQGELFVAGKNIDIETKPNRSAFLLGTTITNKSGSSYDLFAVATKQITLSGTYSNDVYVLGATVTIQPDTVIMGNLYVAGEIINLAGAVKGNTYARSSELNLNQATINGQLTYSADQVASGLLGSHLNNVRYTATTQDSNSPDPISWLIPFFATILTAGVIANVLPRLSYTYLLGLKRAFWRYLGLGWAILLGTPLLCLLFCITLIGYKVAILLACAYIILLTWSSISGVLVVGRLILERLLPVKAEHPWLQSLIGGAVLFGLGLIPGISVVLALVLFPALCGIGIATCRRSFLGKA